MGSTPFSLCRSGPDIAASLRRSALRAFAGDPSRSRIACGWRQGGLAQPFVNHVFARWGPKAPRGAFDPLERCRWNRFVSPCGPAAVLAGAENILRIGRGEQAAAPTANSVVRDAELSRKGQAALDLVSQVADTISATENRIETLLVRALEQLKTMEDRNRVLEERAVAAETRAREAEKWLMRLHVEMEDKFTSWKGQQARGGSSAAA